MNFNYFVIGVDFKHPVGALFKEKNFNDLTHKTHLIFFLY